MARYLGWLANTVLFVLCCLFAARTVNAVIGSSLSAPDEQAAAPAETQLAAAPTWNDRQVILNRNLFNASLLAPTAGGAIEEDLEATKLPLALLGTLAAVEPENSWAAIEDKESHVTRTVRIDDELRPGATVLRIERRRIVLQENGSPRELLLAEDPGMVAAVPARAAAVPRPRQAVRQPRQARTPVPAPAPDGAPALDVRNPATLFSQARILPKYENGQMIGVQLNAIKPGSMFEQIGIKNGDVIKELNGIRIDSPEQSAKILLEFVDAKSFNVVVENAQGTQSLTFTPP